MHLCTAYCHKERTIKLLNLCDILFGFRKGKTENFSNTFRAKSGFLINLLNARDRRRNKLFTFIVGPCLEVE